MANRAPEESHLRKAPYSVGQQILNPTGASIQETTQQLVEERLNMFLPSADINLLDRLYTVQLGIGMSFDYTEGTDGMPIYDVPTVYADIGGTEYQLTIAKHNDLESLHYQALPSRIEDGEESYSYTEVIPQTAVGSLSTVTPASLVFSGHLYITIRNNSTWEYRGRTKIYFPKVYIAGTTRKGTSVEECIPARYNGTFKTVNQWSAVESVFVSYMDDTAEITVEVLPFDQESALDNRNLVVYKNDIESRRFFRLGTQAWGSTLISEGFTVDMAIVQAGVDTKDTEYEIELLDESSQNISLVGAAWKPNTNYMFAADNTNLYIYDTRLPYPNLTGLQAESPDTKMDLWSDRWVYVRDSVAVVNTDTLDVSSIPWQFRWTLKEPDGTISYLGADGSKWPTTVNAWIWNQMWEQGDWKEQRMEVLLDQTGVYILTLECLYSDPEYPNNDSTKTTRFLMYVPAIQPEATLPLPTALQDASGIMFDSDGKLWFLVDSDLCLSNIFYDYFLVDYERKTVFLRENYSSVRVVV
jgi:hypothetical protein